MQLLQYVLQQVGLGWAMVNLALLLSASGLACAVRMNETYKLTNLVNDVGALGLCSSVMVAMLVLLCMARVIITNWK